MEAELHQLNYAGPGGARKQYALVQRRKPIAEFLVVSTSTFVWSFAAYFVLAIGVGWIFFFSGFLLGFQALFVVVMLFPVIAAAAGRVRHRRAMAVLGYLNQAMRLNQPINRVLAAALLSEQGRLRRQLGELRVELEAGSRLSVALGWTVPEMPSRAIALIEYAEQSAQLPQTLNRLIEEESREVKPLAEKQAFATWYPPTQLLVITTCLLFMSLFAAPKFRQIFVDFHIPMPAIVVWLSGWDAALMVLLPVLAITILIGCGVQLRQAVRLRRPTWIFTPIIDRIVWFTPILGTLQQDRALADVCTVVADSVEQGHSLTASLVRSAQLEMNLMFERKIKRCTEALTAGATAPDAARSARMPPLLVGLLSTGQSTENAAEALRFAARVYRDRFIARRAILAELMVPVMTILTGLLVGLVTYSIFDAMRHLIDAVSPFPGGL